MNNYLALLIGSYLALSSQPESGINSTATLNQQWQSFKLEHGKTYENEHVESLRRNIFASSLNKIDQFNEQRADDLGFSLGSNQFSDLTEAEANSMNHGFKLPNNFRSEMLRNSDEAQKFLDDILNDKSIEVPDAIDWRQTPGRVSPVKNEGMCNADWAFAAAGALEGQEAVRKMNGSWNGDLIALSAQNLLDCVEDHYGCIGGWIRDAFEYVKTAPGINDEQSYPYEGKDGECRFKKDKVIMTDNGAAILETGNEDQLKEMVAKFGPVTVGIDTGFDEFLYYKGGVFVDDFCRNEIHNLDKAFLVVGYGTDPKGGDYWLVKNSWGTKWGEGGTLEWHGTGAICAV